METITITSNQSNMSSQENYVILKELQGEILSFLPVTTLFQIQSVCKSWKIMTEAILRVHHNKFTARVKLYSVIIKNKIVEEDYPWPEDANYLLSSKLDVVSNDNPIYIKYKQEDKQEYETSNQENTIHEEDTQEEGVDEENTQEYEIDTQEKGVDEENTDEDGVDEDTPKLEQFINIKTCLEGETYEYSYDDNVSDFKINCAVCNTEAFLPVMVKYTATSKDFRDRRNYFDGYDVVCRRCIHKRTKGDYEYRSNWHENVDIVIGLTCTEFESDN